MGTIAFQDRGRGVRHNVQSRRRQQRVVAPNPLAPASDFAGSSFDRLVVAEMAEESGVF